jgi:alcohol dehydrogenase, propanol-preferring
MVARTMKAALLRTPAPIDSGPLSIEQYPVPEPGPGELLVKVTACGVCRSNLHLAEGDWVHFGVPAKSPIIPGHEVVGRVEMLGAGVEGFAPGDRVGVTPWKRLCGTCHYCLTGREQLCQGSKEITGETVDGGYAEYMISNAAYTFHLPDSIPDAEAAPLFCAGLTAIGSVSKVRPGPGQRVAMFGLGGVAHIVMQLVQLNGADVVAVVRTPKHRALAEELGAVRVIDMSKEDAGEALSRDGGVDAAIVFAPSNEAMRQAIDATRPGGIIVAGAHLDIGTFNFGTEKTIVGSVLGGREQMRDLLRIADRGLLRPRVEVFPLDDAVEVLRRLKYGEISARAVLAP